MQNNICFIFIHKLRKEIFFLLGIFFIFVTKSMFKNYDSVRKTKFKHALTKLLP